jgi:methylated-DNA-[protein]-cysteine S-methyltransferase
MLYEVIDSPLGPLLLTGDGRALTGVRMEGAPQPGWRRRHAAFADAAQQLHAYFAGELRRFDLPLAPHGTPFQRGVWSALIRIPYAETATYGEIAAEVGRPDAPRAVGAANGQNPIAVIIPCHRVIGAGGTLTGYGGGLERKRMLLELEAGVSSLAGIR